MLILYTILFFTFTLFYNQSFHLFNHLDYFMLLIPLLEYFPKEIINIPFWHYLISFITPYLLNMIYYFWINKNFKWSTFLNCHLNYLSNLIPPLIILGWENFIPLSDFYQSFTGLVGLSLTYILYPVLFRLTNGRNSNSWNRKIDFYFNYYSKSFRNWFIVDNLERIYLGINGILYLNNNQNSIFVFIAYLSWKIIDSFILLPFRINMKKNYYFFHKTILHLITLSLVLTHYYLKLPFWSFFINFGINQIIFMITLFYSEPFKTKVERRLSLNVIV